MMDPKEFRDFASTVLILLSTAECQLPVPGIGRARLFDGSPTTSRWNLAHSFASWLTHDYALFEELKRPEQRPMRSATLALAAAESITRWEKVGPRLTELEIVEPTPSFVGVDFDSPAALLALDQLTRPSVELHR